MQLQELGPGQGPNNCNTMPTSCKHAYPTPSGNNPKSQVESTPRDKNMTLATMTATARFYYLRTPADGKLRPPLSQPAAAAAARVRVILSFLVVQQHATIMHLVTRGRSRLPPSKESAATGIVPELGTCYYDIKSMDITFN